MGLLPGDARGTTRRRRARATPVAVSPGVIVGVFVLLVAQVAGAVEALRTMADTPP